MHLIVAILSWPHTLNDFKAFLNGFYGWPSASPESLDLGPGVYFLFSTSAAGAHESRTNFKRL